MDDGVDAIRGGHNRRSVTHISLCLLDFQSGQPAR